LVAAAGAAEVVVLFFATTVAFDSVGVELTGTILGSRVKFHGVTTRLMPFDVVARGGDAE
jgi:hypothetical protein